MQVMKDKTGELLSELESELSPDSFADAMERGQARELEHVAGMNWRGHSGLVLN